MTECWIRPITPRILVESLRVAHASNPISMSDLEKCLSVEPRRASEIFRQLQSMGLLRELDANSSIITDRGIRLLEAIVRDDRERVHQILMQYEPYRVVHRLLEDRALTIQEIVESSSMNYVAVETILRIIEWASPKLRRSRKHAFYIAQSTSLDVDTYAKNMEDLWKKMASTEFGIKREFVRIPDLRDRLCETLRIDTSTFDNLFLKLLQMSPGRFELSGAPGPVTSASKDQGVRVAGKPFFYVRMTDRR